MSTIAENLNALYNIKEGIKAAIEGKGVDVGEAPFAEYPQKINEIEVGGADCEGVYQEGWDDGYTKGFYEGEDTHYNEGWMDCKKNYETKMVDLVVTENGIYNDAHYGYKSVNVTVVPKIHVKDGIHFGYSNFEYIPEYFDFQGIKDASYMFWYCRNLLEAPYMDLSECDTLLNTFSNCYKLVIIPWMDTSKVTNMNYAFRDTSITTIPSFDTSKVTNMSRMFDNCSKLVSVPALDASSLVKQSYGLFGSGNSDKLTDFGGLINLKASIDKYNFEKCPNLTRESCINILNGLYNFTGNGETPNSNQGVLKVHQNFLDLVGEDISIGIDKGWTITA